jgi:PAS domain S-box-containing protein
METDLSRALLSEEDAPAADARASTPPEHILLLIDGTGNRRQIERELGKHYTVGLGWPDAEETRPVDLVMVDGPSFLRNREKLLTLKKETCGYLPVLLVLSKRQSEGVDEMVFEVADEVVRRPLARVELTGRVRALLRARSYALEALRQTRRSRLLGASVEEASDAVLVTEAEPGAEGKRAVVYANPAFTEMTGYEREEIVGRTRTLLYGAETDRAALDRIAEALANEEPIQEELLGYRKDGGQYWVETSIVPVRDEKGTTTHFASIQHETTARRAYEAKLADAKAEAERLADLKSSLLHNMNRELRTPLSAILDRAERLETKSREAGKEHARAIQQSGERLMRTLDSVLVLSKLEGGSVALSHHRVDLARLAEETVQSMAPQAERKGLAVEAHLPDERPVEAETSASIVERILANLLFNAIKYTDEGTITLRLFTEEERAVLQVKDPGAGISEEALPHIFEDFVTQQPSAPVQEQREGVGLGLAITQRFVALIGGEIDVASAPDADGSTFTVRLPL